MSATAEVSVESPASPQLARELWISFSSLLRSHVAMHSIAAPSHSLRLHSSKEARLDLLGPFGKLSIVAPNASGLGTIEFRPEKSEVGDEYATFFFTEHGLVQLEDLESPLDVEAAVEYWLRKVQA
jgi:hypothetical protein